MDTHPKTDIQIVYEALATSYDGMATSPGLVDVTKLMPGRVNQALKQLAERNPAYAVFDKVEMRWTALVPLKETKFLQKHDRTPPRPKAAPKAKPVPRLPEVEAVIEAMSDLIAKYEDLVNGLQPLIKLMEVKDAKQ